MHARLARSPHPKVRWHGSLPVALLRRVTSAEAMDHYTVRCMCKMHIFCLASRWELRYRAQARKLVRPMGAAAIALHGRVWMGSSAWLTALMAALLSHHRISATFRDSMRPPVHVNAGWQWTGNQARVA